MRTRDGDEVGVVVKTENPPLESGGIKEWNLSKEKAVELHILPSSNNQILARTDL